MRFALVSAAAVLLVSVSSSPASATPPDIPSVAAAKTELAALAVAAESHVDSYDRALFPHWAQVRGACNVRELLLQFEAETVTVDRASCAPIEGRWRSPYDGAVWTLPADLDIDHMVPLSEAWKSGAHAWSPERRKAFANSLLDSQLWVVTDNVNQSKGDQDPSAWQPPLAPFRCAYAKSWVDVKFDWGLT
ncbi:GmrSD restriction endonuclease domain-containing protein, partial [Nonomuraea soli]|uniref:GmrSD restriction endonuclease domain-containing protein n=1 Tax=Nonomuraea soli TaxID=1032476 RepID=UPI0031E7DA30